MQSGAKVVVLAEGEFQVPLHTFVSLALVLRTSLRRVARGSLRCGARYGQRAFEFLVGHALTFTLAVVVVLIVLYIANRLVMHTTPAED